MIEQEQGILGKEAPRPGVVQGRVWLWLWQKSAWQIKKHL